MNVVDRGGRINQRRRTRKELLRAAARLMAAGGSPSLEAIAAEAMVSRATAYRYFPGLDALLAESALDMAVPTPEELFRHASSDDPVARVERVDGALHEMILANEASIRAMLVNSLQLGTRNERDPEVPARQNRRTPLIEAALKPARDQFKPAALKSLSRALALIVGPEAVVVFRDVLQLDDAEARKVKRWAIRALIEAAKKG
jgi:AcrR family transcriptional regulator